MIYRLMAFAKKQPFLFVSFIAAWLAFVPMSFAWYVESVAYNQKVSPGKYDRLLMQIYHLPHAEQVAATFWIGGWVIALGSLLAGAYRELRRRRDASRQPP